MCDTIIVTLLWSSRSISALYLALTKYKTNSYFDLLLDSSNPKLSYAVLWTLMKAKFVNQTAVHKEGGNFFFVFFLNSPLIADWYCCSSCEPD